MVSKYVVEKAVSGICVILTVARQSGYAGLNFEGPDDQHWRWCRLIVRLVMSLNLREIIKEIGDTKYPIYCVSSVRRRFTDKDDHNGPESMACGISTLHTPIFLECEN